MKNLILKSSFFFILVFNFCYANNKTAFSTGSKKLTKKVSPYKKMAFNAIHLIDFIVVYTKAKRMNRYARVRVFGCNVDRGAFEFFHHKEAFKREYKFSDKCDVSGVIKMQPTGFFDVDLQIKGSSQYRSIKGSFTFKFNKPNEKNGFKLYAGNVYITGDKFQLKFKSMTKYFLHSQEITEEDEKTKEKKVVNRVLTVGKVLGQIKLQEVNHNNTNDIINFTRKDLYY